MIRQKVLKPSNQKKSRHWKTTREEVHVPDALEQLI